MRLNARQQKIIEIVKGHGPITSEQIADLLDLRRATLRPDLAILTMSGILEARPRVGYSFAGNSSPSLVAEEIRRIQVQDVKSVPVVVPEKASVYDAVVTMFTEDVGTLFVVRASGALEGVVSRKDLLKVTLGQSDVHQMPVNVIMTRMPNIITTTPEESVFQAAKKLIEAEVDALPVVRQAKDEAGRPMLEVTGRFTKTNATRLFVELAEG